MAKRAGKSLASSEENSRIAELMLKKEPLNPKLRRYVKETSLGPVFRHPLLAQPWVNVEQAAWINWMVEHKQKFMEECRQKKKWEAVLAHYETYYLLDGFVEEARHVNDATYWKLLAYVYTKQEQLWPNRKMLLQLLQAPRPQRDKLMERSEHRAFSKLPESFPAYRGFIGQRGKGLSWTTDREKAVWFAERFACLEHLGKPRLASGHVVKKDVLAYFTRREESEIVIDPTKVKRQTIVTI